MALNDPVRDGALAARYGDQPRPAEILHTPVIEAQLAHRSVRAYRSDPLPDALVETLVASAQSAANSSNLQLWSVAAVTDRAIKARLAVLAGDQRHIDDAPLLLLFVADHARAAAVADREGASVEGLDYIDTLLVSAIDVGIAAQNAALAAESLGLGTVYIGGMRNRPIEVAEAIDLPPRAVVLVGLVVGYPDPARPAAIKPRLPQAAVLHRDTYDAAPEAGAVRGYDRVSRGFQTSQGLPATGWIASLITRAGSIGQRKDLRAALAALGFALR